MKPVTRQEKLRAAAEDSVERITATSSLALADRDFWMPTAWLAICCCR